VVSIEVATPKGRQGSTLPPVCLSGGLRGPLRSGGDDAIEAWFSVMTVFQEMGMEEFEETFYDILKSRVIILRLA
jgi:hypothetical protein